MGQAANSNRNASLDSKKERAAGRSGERSSVRKAVQESTAKGATGGAFGAGGKANRAPAGFSPARRASRPSRKRKG
jgi:hypothetical protein